MNKRLAIGITMLGLLASSGSVARRPAAAYDLLIRGGAI